MRTSQRHATDEHESASPGHTTGASTRYGAIAERVAGGRGLFGRPLTCAEKVLVSHLRRPRRRAAAAGQPTSTSIPTASPCKTPSRRSWRCSS